MVRSVFSASPEFFIFRRVFIILSSCLIPAVWARSLVKVSGSGDSASILAPELLKWIRMLACGAGDPGFKSLRARHKKARALFGGVMALCSCLLIWLLAVGVFAGEGCGGVCGRLRHLGFDIPGDSFCD